MRPPNATVSYEEYEKVYNLDLPRLSPSELENEAFLAARIAAHDPERFVWRGTVHISARKWADERIVLCRKLLDKSGGSNPPPPRRKRAKASIPVPTVAAAP
jgi:hypothetical protein